MLSTLARLMLTASSIAPVGLTYALVAWYQKEYSVAIWATAVSVVVVAGCVVILGIAQEQLEEMSFKSKEIEPSDNENIGFMLLYLLPLFTEKITNLNWVVWLPTLLVYGVIVATGAGYHFNPLLSILGWHFYKITSVEGVKYVLVTKKHLRTAATTIAVGQLTDYMLIDLGGKGTK
jgi:hypothetical protein